MVSKEINTVHSENHAIPINTLWAEYSYWILQTAVSCYSRYSGLKWLVCASRMPWTEVEEDAGLWVCNAVRRKKK